jgi:hypothetical protein
MILPDPNQFYPRPQLSAPQHHAYTKQRQIPAPSSSALSSHSRINNNTNPYVYFPGPPQNQSSFPSNSIQNHHHNERWYTLSNNLYDWFETNGVPMTIPIERVQPQDYVHHLNVMIDEFNKRKEMELTAYKEAFKQKETEIRTILLTGDLCKNYGDLFTQYQALFTQFQTLLEERRKNEEKKEEIVVAAIIPPSASLPPLRTATSNKKKKIPRLLETDNNKTLIIRRSNRTRIPSMKRYEGDEVSYLPLSRSLKNKEAL